MPAKKRASISDFTLTVQLLPPPLAKHRQIQRAYVCLTKKASALEMAKEF